MKALWTGRKSFKPRPGSRSSVRTHGIFAREMPRFKTPNALVAALAIDLEKTGIRSTEARKRSRHRPKSHFGKEKRGRNGNTD